MSDVLIRICDYGTVAVEDNNNGVRGFKKISPDFLLACINQSLLRGAVSSDLLPKGCISYTAHDSGERSVTL